MRSILLIGDHFISPSLMRENLVGRVTEPMEIKEASTPFPLEPFRDIAEVKEASGSEDEMIEALSGVALCIAHHAPLTERVLRACPDLGLFVVCRGGPVNVNLSAATAAGVTVGFTPGRNAAATAEFSVAMALAALRRIPTTDAGIRRGEWPGNYTFDSVGFELEGSVCGVIGFGEIGKRVARILQGFGATVLVFDPYAPVEPEETAERVSLEVLLQRSRLVSLHARETAESRGMIGKEQIASMQKGAVLINCARGALVNYDALAEALRSGHLFAAAADVFPEEPIPPHSDLRDLPNFVMTPHIAGGTRQSAEKACRIAGEEVARYLRGEPLRYCANPS